MIRIITAIGTPSLNSELRRYSEFEVIGNDISYFDGILEALELDNNINYIVISDSLEPENIDTLINEVIKVNKNIKIMAVINRKKAELEKYLLKNGITDIVYDDEEMTDIINMLKTKNIEYLNIELREEIDKLKKMIVNKNSKALFRKKDIGAVKESKIIGVSGPRGVGKTMFCLYFAHSNCCGKRVLIVDFDVINSQLSEVMKKNIEYSKVDGFNLKDLTFKVNENIDVLVGLNYFYNFKKLNYKKVKSELEIAKQKYDYIIVDTYSDANFENNKLIFDMFDRVVLLSKVNKSELIKTKKLEYVMVKKWNVNSNKINIVFSLNGYFDGLGMSMDKLKNYFNECICLAKIYRDSFNYFCFRKGFSISFFSKLQYKKIAKTI